MSKITIAIDGFSSTGKSTVARQLARALDYLYVDSGAMYRAITLFALRNNYVQDSDPQCSLLVAKLPDIKLEFVYDSSTGDSDIYLNGENVEKLVEIQREMGKDKGVVMDGRDIGSVVFPDAELKIFITAAPDVRAERRYKELLSRGEDVTYEEVLKNIRERDYIDSHREFSPLIRAEDAIELDNSELDLEEQFEKVYQLARSTIDQTI